MSGYVRLDQVRKAFTDTLTASQISTIETDAVDSEDFLGGVGFSTSKTSWVSRIIRWFTDGRTSHTFLVYHDTDWNRDMVMEATQGGYRIVPFEHYKNSLVAIFEPKHSLDKGLAASVDWLGENYDYKGLFGMAWVELGRWLKRKWRNPWQSAKAMFCSEAVVRVMQGSDYPGAEKFDPGSTDPEMLLRFFENGGGTNF